MSKQHKKAESTKSATLTRALAEDGGSNRELAERAGVSFRAIAEARNGLESGWMGTKRKRLGVVSSMTRLATSLKLPPGDVLQELGIDVSDAAVQRQMARARKEFLQRNLEEDEEDPVMRAISAREIASSRSTFGPGPIVGVVQWKPFSAEDAGRGSVAKLLARSILGSLNPAWDREANIRPEKSFMDAERRLLSNDSDKPDCLIGLYDLPWRRRQGVDVVALPGLYVALGGLSTRPLGWREILASRDDTLPHALVVEGDIGDRLLSGPVDYPGGRLITPRLKTREISKVAERIQRELSNPPPNGLLFVADGPLVSEVRELLDDSVVTEIEDPEWAPVVPFGFAVRHEAGRFKELIKEALSEDLLGRAFPRTVHLYFALLRNDRACKIRLDLAELGSQVRGGASKFIELADALEPGWKGLLERAVVDKKMLDALTSPADTPTQPSRESQ